MMCLLLHQADKINSTVTKALSVFALSIAIYENSFQGAFSLAIAGVTVRF